MVSSLKHISKKLEFIRKSEKLTRRALSELSGFNERTILSYERAERTPSDDYITFISAYFGYDKNSILDNNMELKKLSEKEQKNAIAKNFSNTIEKALQPIKDLNISLDKTISDLKLPFANLPNLQFKVIKDDIPPKHQAIINLLPYADDDLLNSIIKMLEINKKNKDEINEILKKNENTK